MRLLTLLSARLTVDLRFEPRDLWVGLYWNTLKPAYPRYGYREWYLCLVPLVPLHVRYWIPPPPAGHKPDVLDTDRCAYCHLNHAYWPQFPCRGRK